MNRIKFTTWIFPFSFSLFIIFIIYWLIAPTLPAPLPQQQTGKNISVEFFFEKEKLNLYPAIATQKEQAPSPESASVDSIKDSTSSENQNKLKKKLFSCIIKDILGNPIQSGNIFINNKKCQATIIFPPQRQLFFPVCSSIKLKEKHLDF